MPTPETHTAAAGLTGGFVHTAIAYAFDIPPALLGVVFIGAFIGLVLRPSEPLPAAGFGRFKLFIKECIWLVLITAVASWLVPWFVQLMPTMAQKTIAAFSGLGLMLKREKITDLFDKALHRVEGEVEK